jgi:hypothetical protein
MSTLKQNKWAVDFCGCCSYRDKDGNCTFFPYFIPMAVCGTCCILGRVRSLYIGESIHCCDMGSEGWCLCLFSFPIHLFGPFGGFIWEGVNSMKMRSDVREQLNIDESKTLQCCCFSCPSFCIGIEFTLQ